MNYIKTGFLLVVLTMLFVWIGGYFGGQIGATYAFLFAFIMNIGAYWFSDRIVLSMYRAKEVEPAEVPELYNIMRELASNAKLPMPKVYIAPQNSPNAFATGRNPKHAAVCVTQGILNLLNREELRGVVAHELSHIKNRDTLIMTVTATIAGAITMLASWARWAAIFGGFGGRGGRSRDSNIFGYLFMLIVAPIAAMLVQLAISRSREYAADKRGAYIAKSPTGLADALLKLEKGAGVYPMNANNATAHLFIVNPLRGKGLAALFSTHPPVQKRVELLRNMAIQ
ncbi:MAG: zinc metalloprotease HtpX [Candidatus Omnitrophica bacterium]|nr:zinc metalloprotease HtpX [Candidatus Omnitrophota bacterium]MBU1852596.1 zinc metalloprotease HtpX [Candidatus Omnitrophota bacterium]